MRNSIPPIRISLRNEAPVRPEREFVLYWMTAFRRLHWNFALDRAVHWARELKKPLVILEALRCDYPWANDRFHRFVIDGMAEKIASLSKGGAFFYPYVEGSFGEGKGLLAALGTHSCVVIADDFPCFFLPAWVRAAALQLPVRLEAVDSNGLLPLRAAERTFSTAHAFRRFLQYRLPEHLSQFPRRDPLARSDFPRLHSLPEEVVRRWTPATAAQIEDPNFLARIPIHHKIGATSTRGGEKSARLVLQTFLKERLAQYAEIRNRPEKQATSGLSPYLHFGHISSHEVFAELMEREKWAEENLALRTNGSRKGWWGVCAAIEEFLDQLITWRELGFNFSSGRADYDQYDSLPDWARRTLSSHARDKRQPVYTLEDFAGARTHDPLWNAAQRQLSREGRIHNYLRMLWGKKILKWSRSPQEALEIMIELNNRFALDGRDPNSYSGIFWCLGRYDRP